MPVFRVAPALPCLALACLAGEEAKCSFRASCDKGMTWPDAAHDADGSLGARWAPATEFAYPHMPCAHHCFPPRRLLLLPAPR